MSRAGSRPSACMTAAIAWHMALVIHGPDVDYMIELAAHEFVVVIGNVAGESR